MTITATHEPKIKMPRQREAVRLPEGALPCLGCGVAVPRASAVEQVVSYGVRAGRATADVCEMTRCPDCARTLARAETILAEHDRVRRVIGSRVIAVYRVESTLLALDALGVKDSQVDVLTSTDSALRLAIEHLAVIGAVARWSSRFAPIRDRSADPRTCAPKRWAHISDDIGQGLRDRYGALLRARTETPVPVPPPEDGAPACLLCGVGTITVLPSKAEDAWGRPWSATPSTLGGRGSRPVRGHLCPSCTPAAENVGALGPTATERALIHYLGVTISPMQSFGIAGLRAWAGLPAGTPPNETPWDHESDLDALAEQLRAP